MPHIGKSKEQLREMPLDKLKEEVEQEAYIALRQYFDQKGNGPEAKVAKDVLATIAREHQAKNNGRQLDLIEKRLLKA